MAPRHFIDIDRLDSAVLRNMLDHAHAMKAAWKKGGQAASRKLVPAACADTTLVMIFERPSTRTRVSFDVAMRHLGGESLAINPSELQLGRGETIGDTAQVLSRYVDAILLRTGSHETLLELAANATVPVINGLTNHSHPCQIMADIMTFEEVKGPVAGQTIAWVGDGNNVANSFIHAAWRLGFKLRLGCPPELTVDPDLVKRASKAGADIIVTADPVEAVKGAACVVTDTWVSMGDEDAARRKMLLGPYQVNAKLMKKAAKGAIFMHCLPAYRGNEVTKDILDGPTSVVLDEAENRLHAQKAILAWCLAGAA